MASFCLGLATRFETDNVDSPQSVTSCRTITAVLTCPSLRVPSHTVADAASSPVHTASMAITHAPMLLMTLRFPTKDDKGTNRPSRAQGGRGVGETVAVSAKAAE